MGGADRRLLAARRQPLQPELAHRLQHREARLAAGAVVRRRSRLLSTSEATPVEDGDRRGRLGRRDRLGRLQREAAGEDGQAAEERLLLRRQQVVAPGDRVAHRPLPGGRSRAAAGQQRQPLAQPGQQRRRRQDATRAAASSIASGRPSSRRQTSATAAALPSVRAKAGRGRPRALRRRGPPPRSASAAGGRRARRVGQRPGAAPGTRARRGRAAAPGWWPAPAGAGRPRARPAICGRGREHLLAVVQDQQELARRAGRGERARQAAGRRPRARRAPGRSPGGRGPGRGAGRGRRRPTPSAKAARGLGAMARARRVLPTPPGPVSVSSGTASSRRQGAGGGHLGRAPDERRARVRQGRGAIGQRLGHGGPSDGRSSGLANHDNHDANGPATCQGGVTATRERAVCRGRWRRGGYIQSSVSGSEGPHGRSRARRRSRRPTSAGSSSGRGRRWLPRRQRSACERAHGSDGEPPVRTDAARSNSCWSVRSAGGRGRGRGATARRAGGFAGGGRGLARLGRAGRRTRRSRRARSVAVAERPAAPGQQRKPAIQPLQQRGRWQHLDPRRGELDRERQAVEAAADLGHRARVLRRQREPGSAARARATKRRTAADSPTAPRGVASGSGRAAPGYSCSPPRPSGSRLVTSAPAPGSRPATSRRPARPRSPARSCRGGAGGAARAAPRPTAGRWGRRPPPDPDRVRDRRRDQRGIVERREVDEDGAVREVARPRHGERERRLADPARPGQRHQADAAAEHGDDVGDVPLPADQGRQRVREGCACVVAVLFHRSPHWAVSSPGLG